MESIDELRNGGADGRDVVGNGSGHEGLAPASGDGEAAAMRGRTEGRGGELAPASGEQRRRCDHGSGGPHGQARSEVPRCRLGGARRAGAVPAATGEREEPGRRADARRREGRRAAALATGNDRARSSVWCRRKVGWGPGGDPTRIGSEGKFLELN